MAETTTGTDIGYDRHDPNTRFIAMLGGLLVIVLIAAVFGVQYYYDRVREQQVYVQVLEPQSEMLLDLRARENQELLTYQYLDRDAGTVRVPIERAMELLVEEAAEGDLPYPTTPYPVVDEEASQ